MGDLETGKVWHYGKDNLIVASYSESKKRDYGAIRYYAAKPDAKAPRLLDSFYSPYPFSKVTHLEIDPTTTLLLTSKNGIIGKSHDALVLQNGQFSKSKVVGGIYDNRKITMMTGSGKKNILAIYEKDGKVLVDAAVFTKASQGIDDFSLEFDQESEDQSFSGHKAYSFVDTRDKIIFFYSKKQDQENFIFSRTYNKETNKMSETEQVFTLPTDYPKFSPKSIKCLDDDSLAVCAYLVDGSYAVYTKFEIDGEQVKLTDQVLIALSSAKEPAEDLYVSMTEIIITHIAGADMRQEISLFKIGSGLSTPEVGQQPTPNIKISLPFVTEELEKGEKLLNVNIDEEGAHVLYLQDHRTETKSSYIVTKKMGDYTLVGKGVVTSSELQQYGF